MRKLNKKEKSLLFLAAGICLIFLINKFLLSGFRTKLGDLRSQVRLEEKRLISGIAARNDKDEILNDYNAYRPYFAAEVSDVKQALLSEIQRLAKESGVSIINLSPQEAPEASSSLKRCKAELRLEGTPQEIFSFLDKFQQSRFLIKMDKLTFNSKDLEALQIRIDALVSMVIF